MMTIKLVSPLGFRQIRQWLLDVYNENNIAYMQSVGLDKFVHAWAEDAESRDNNELELPAHLSRSGRIEYLRPDMYELEINDEI